MRQIRIASISIFAILVLIARHGASQVPYLQAGLPIEQRVNDLLARMTLKEKVRQLDLYKGATTLMDKHLDDTHAARDAAFLPAKAEAIFRTLGAGGIHDLYPSPEQSNTIQKWVIAHNRLGIPVLFIEEGLHGFDKSTVFPVLIGLAATWNTELAENIGSAIAAEMRSTGVDMVLAPVLDLARDPRWGRVEEDYGEDPFFTGLLGLVWVRGAQGQSLASDHTVVAEPKHFAGHGSPEGGTNTSPVRMGERELRTVMLRGFEPAIREGHAIGVMAAYHEIDGIPITADPFLLKTVLRQEWGFQGFVLSDLNLLLNSGFERFHMASTADGAVHYFELVTVRNLPAPDEIDLTPLRLSIPRVRLPVASQEFGTGKRVPKSPGASNREDFRGKAVPN